MRRAELCRLKITDFNPERSVIRVLGKGDKLREIPIPDAICQELLLYLKRINRSFPVILKVTFLTDKGAPLYLFVNNVVKRSLRRLRIYRAKIAPFA